MSIPRVTTPQSSLIDYSDLDNILPYSILEELDRSTDQKNENSTESRSIKSGTDFSELFPNTGTSSDQFSNFPSDSSNELSQLLNSNGNKRKKDPSLENPVFKKTRIGVPESLTEKFVNFMDPSCTDPKIHAIFRKIADNPYSRIGRLRCLESFLSEKSIDAYVKANNLTSARKNAKKVEEFLNSHHAFSPSENNNSINSTPYLEQQPIHDNQISSLTDSTFGSKRKNNFSLENPVFKKTRPYIPKDLTEKFIKFMDSSCTDPKIHAIFEKIADNPYSRIRRLRCFKSFLSEKSIGAYVKANNLTSARKNAKKVEEFLNAHHAFSPPENNSSINSTSYLEQQPINNNSITGTPLSQLSYLTPPQDL